MLRDHRLEGVAGELQEVRVAQRHDGRRPGSVRQQRHLAESLGRAQARDPGRPPVVVASRDADDPGDECVERVPRRALLEQRLAARHRHRHHAGPHGLDRRRIEPGQERDLGCAHACPAPWTCADLAKPRSASQATPAASPRTSLRRAPSPT